MSEPQKESNENKESKDAPKEGEKKTGDYKGNNPGGEKSKK